MAFVLVILLLAVLKSIPAHRKELSHAVYLGSQCTIFAVRVEKCCGGSDTFAYCKMYERDINENWSELFYRVKNYYLDGVVRSGISRF